MNRWTDNVIPLLVYHSLVKGGNEIKLVVLCPKGKLIKNQTLSNNANNFYLNLTRNKFNRKRKKSSDSMIINIINHYKLPPKNEPNIYRISHYKLPPKHDPSRAPKSIELTTNSWSKQVRQNLDFSCNTAPDIIPRQ